MKAVAIIPARMASKRYPGKPLALINGQPMILHVLAKARQISGLSEVIVATDDDTIKSIVADAGGKVVMTSSNHESGTDRVAEVAATLYRSDDIILNIQGDLPFFEPRVGKQLIESLHKFTEADIATPVQPQSSEYELRNSNIVKAIFTQRCQALFFSRFPLGCGNGLWYKHIGVYAYRNSVLQKLADYSPTLLEKTENLEQIRALEYGFKIYCMITTDDCGIDVNCPDDLKRINR